MRTRLPTMGVRSIPAVVLAGALLGSPSLCAQGSPSTPSSGTPAVGILTGVVRDSAGTPLRDVYVRISGVSQGTSLQPRTTDQAGVFRVESLSPGSYSVTYSLVGYSRQTDSVTVRAGRTEKVTATLKPAPLVIGQLGRFPAESDSTPVQLEFQTKEGQPPGYCDGVQLVETTTTTISVSGFLGSGASPLNLHARAYRDGSGIVLDVIPQPQDLVTMVAACVEWRAVISGLPTSVYTLNVREVQDPRIQAEALLILNAVFDLRQPGAVMRGPVTTP